MPEAEPEPQGTSIDCALDGADDFASDCLIEIAGTGGDAEYILHRPDGGFRRIAIGPDGGYRSLDGADEVSQVEVGDATIVGIGGDRFAIPRAEDASAAYD